MRKIAIHKHSDKNEDYAGKIQRVYLMPLDKTDEEIEQKVNEYNSSQDSYVASTFSIADEIVEAVEWLIRDRRLDVSRHLEALDDIKRELEDIADTVHSTVRNIEEKIEKQD